MKALSEHLNEEDIKKLKDDYLKQLREHPNPILNQDAFMFEQGVINERSK